MSEQSASRNMKNKYLPTALRGGITSAILAVVFGVSSNASAAITTTPGSVEWSVSSTYFPSTYAGQTDDVVTLPIAQTITGVYFKAAGAVEAAFAATFIGATGTFTFNYDPIDLRYENNTPQAIAAFSSVVGSKVTYNIDGFGPNHVITGVGVTVVPEPSAALLGALGAFGILRRRRVG